MTALQMVRQELMTVVQMVNQVQMIHQQKIDFSQKAFFKHALEALQPYT